MAEDIVSIGIAYDTSQLTTGTRQIQEALRPAEQAKKSTQMQTQALEQSSGRYLTQGLTQDTQA